MLNLTGKPIIIKNQHGRIYLEVHGKAEVSNQFDVAEDVVVDGLTVTTFKKYREISGLPNPRENCIVDKEIAMLCGDKTCLYYVHSVDDKGEVEYLIKA
jgi:hypothetical protein